MLYICEFDFKQNVPNMKRLLILEYLWPFRASTFVCRLVSANTVDNKVINRLYLNVYHNISFIYLVIDSGITTLLDKFATWAILLRLL